MILETREWLSQMTEGGRHWTLESSEGWLDSSFQDPGVNSGWQVGGPLPGWLGFWSWWEGRGAGVGITCSLQL